MTRHYSTTDFFRQMPNALLARYFQARGLFVDLDFSAMKETKPDDLFTAWLELPDSGRNEMDAEFRDIFELSCEKGSRAIIDEADWHLVNASVHARSDLYNTLARQHFPLDSGVIPRLPVQCLAPNGCRKAHSDPVGHSSHRTFQCADGEP